MKGGASSSDGVQLIRWGVPCLAVLLVLFATVGSEDRAWVLVREALLVQNFFEAPPEPMRFSPPDAAERDEFLRERGYVTIVVPWAMRGVDILDLYGLRNNAAAHEAVERKAGALEGLLLERDTLVVELN